MFNREQQLGELTQALDKNNLELAAHLQALAQKAKVVGKISAFFTAKTFAAAGETYASFGTVAMVYKPGLWLIAPVGTGGLIGLTDAMLDKLCEKNPNNEKLKFLKGKSNIMNLGVTYCGDLGFTFSMLKTVGAIITQGRYAKEFSNIIFPTLATASLIPAGAITRLRYKQSLGQDDAVSLKAKMLRHLSATLRGAASTTGLTAPLQIQGILGPQLPTALIILTGFLGLLSSVAKEKHPDFSFYMMLCLQMFCEHASLAMTLFSLLNDIYAGVTEELYENGLIDISETGVGEGYFYTVMILAVAEFIALGLMVPKQAPQDHIYEVIDNGELEEIVIETVDESSKLSIQ